MPKEIKDGDMKTFLLFLRGDDKIKPIAKSITIKTKKRKTKFKLRCPRYVYTLRVDDEKRAAEQVGMLRAAVPSEEGLVVSEEDAAVRVEEDKDPNLQKMPRKAEDMIKDVVEKITELNRVQRRNLKKLLKAATKGDK